MSDDFYWLKESINGKNDEKMIVRYKNNFSNWIMVNTAVYQNYCGTTGMRIQVLMMAFYVMYKHAQENRVYCIIMILK